MSRPSPLLLLVLPLLAAVLVGAWWAANRPESAGPAIAGGRLESVSFAPYRPGQSPLTGVFPSAAQVDADLALLAPQVRAVRTYAAIEGDYDVAGLAAKHGLKLWQGIWLGPDRAKNAREIAAGIAEANRYPNTVDRVVVGNEVLLRRDLPVGALIAALDQVRAAVQQPVTYADVWEFWEQFPEVARHVDIVTIHLLPYWEDRPTGIHRAVAHVLATYRRMQARFPGQRIAVGETGWPGAGRWRADAAPGVVNEARFIRAFVAAARAEGIDYNLIEAFDQGWKYASEGTVGANWGIWTADRGQKFPFSGPVVEDAAWPRWAGLSVALGLLLLGVGLCTALPAGAQVRLAVLAMGLGGALGYAASAGVPLAYDGYALVAAVGNLAGQAVLGWLLMRRAARLLAGQAVPRGRNAAQATASVRGLLRGRWPREGVFEDLCLLFVWAAAVLQVLLLFDPRYRDFPISTFAVPLVAVAARGWLRDLPRGGGGREEAWLGGVLVLAALAGAVREGPENLQSLAWTGCALLLAVPVLLRVCKRGLWRPG
ncbi:MAG TPA: glycosyl hydrolase family 17 protein [Acetobacteraceae bacterium]|nr:glycosyl hydrolase family 17 protein [Acetobacteraceae bacterium]